jgi:hypothetical protein
MSEPQLGVPGMVFQPGDHVCAMFMGSRQRDEFLLPFLRSGLIAGDKCLCVIDSSDPRSTVEALRGGLREIDVEDCLAAGQVLATGHYRFARAAGEMPELLRKVPGGLEAFIDYEAELNLFTMRHPQLVLVCMYDLDLFGGGIVLDLVRTHSRLLLGGLVLDNPHFRPPTGWAATEPQWPAQI